ncbi:MAG: toxin-antitoxin system HicB family antitoxin [Clostridiaceae bacterium]|nr:toxin-antitoxin system HicB family antitoxin [Clostridiaceae bacterium]
MNKQDFEAKLNNIPVAEPDEQDREAIKRIAKSKAQSTVSHEQLKAEIEYSGKISLRLPKTLHKDLINNAKNEGVSLNQYVLYKLSH